MYMDVLPVCMSAPCACHRKLEESHPLELSSSHMGAGTGPGSSARANARNCSVIFPAPKLLFFFFKIGSLCFPWLASEEINPLLHPECAAMPS